MEETKQMNLLTIKMATVKAVAKTFGIIWGILGALLPADNRQIQYLSQSLGGIVWAPIPFKWYQIDSGYDTV